MIQDIKIAKRPFEKTIFLIRSNNDLLASRQGKQIEVRHESTEFRGVLIEPNKITMMDELEASHYVEGSFEECGRNCEYCAEHQLLLYEDARGI